jgi:hypothetical protein
MDDPYTNDPSVNRHGEHIPPTATLNQSGRQSHGSGSSMTGKVEHAVGSIVGSNALKAKGLEKQR